MKKITTICLVAFITTAVQVQAQGLLGRLANKLEQASSGNGESGSNEKEVKKDVESTVLDGKPIHKDSRNLSGIYFAKYPIRIGQGGTGKYSYAKKFLVNYEEGEKQEIEFISRYYFENRKDIPPLVYAPAPGTPDYFPVTTSKKMGHLYLDGISNKKYGGNATSNYASLTRYIDFFAPDGNYSRQETMAFNYEGLLELEEGILVIGRLDYIPKANTPEKYKFLQEKGSYNLFYKKDKEAKALAMTDAQVWDRMKAFYDPYYKAFKAAEGGNVELVKPVGKFKDEPKNGDLVQAANDRMKSMPHFSEELVYLYPVTTWENRFENIGLMGKTLTHRVLQAQAVLKKGNECQITQFLIRQDNTYRGGSNAENFTGNPVKAVGDIGKTVISCSNAMKYKK
ncbi:hypothetical protein VUJ46_15100 [Chryseobacterium sp. MYb264]|uniref:hypothetical protein n=1 Tax=Chryseobacterium sp. MYb264 TaxID=2745153 RepID=UPI002E123168|nr:hypothetical protein VUJ46_15100 [Chryseobacterium sp. MYb264]